MRVLITGINGFVGKHLAKELASNNIVVFGIGQEGSVNPEISHVVENYFSIDLSQSWPDVEEVDAIIHLAGLAAVGASFDNPQKYININSSIVTNMCEYYIGRDKEPRIVLVSSGAIYSPNQTMPLTESSAYDFSSPYTISKILNEHQAEYYRGRGLDIVCARPFNHIGPQQLEGFLIPDLINKLEEAKTTKSITVGNIDTKRDYTDVRDVVRAYRLLVTTEKLNSYVYNVCSGKSISGKEILRQLQSIIGVPDIEVVIDKSKLRPNDPINIFGDSSQIYKDTGWQANIPLQHTLKDTVSRR